MQTGQWQQAEDLLRQGLEASPDDAEVRRQLAEALWHRGAANEAMSHIAAAVRLKPEDASFAVLTHGWLAHGYCAVVPSGR